MLYNVMVFLCQICVILFCIAFILSFIEGIREYCKELKDEGRTTSNT